MAVTIASFVTLLKGLGISGIHAQAERPMDLTSAELPALWVDTISIEEAPLRRGAMGGTRILRGRVVVVTDSLGQDTNANRWDAALTMMDSLNAAIKAETDLGYNCRWTIDIDSMFENLYFAVIATVETSDWSIT